MMAAYVGADWNCEVGTTLEMKMPPQRIPMEIKKPAMPTARV